MSDRTEAPTPRRIEEAREEGRVARSVELNSAVALLGGALLLTNLGRSLVDAFMLLMKELLAESARLPFEVGRSLEDGAAQNVLISWLYEWGLRIGLEILPGLGGILAGILVLGVVTTLAQTGMLWTSKKMGLDFSRINPLTGFRRMFSMHGLIELLRSGLKLALVGWVAYNFLNASLPDLKVIGQVGLGQGAVRLADLASGMILSVGQAYLALAAVDYAYQRWEWLRGLKMTKQEIKEEYRRSEGDPILKNHIRSQQRRMARGRMMAHVPKSDVVVVNPTHLAVAIEYHAGMNAPRVLAKGAHRLAERIVELARQNNIPVVQNIPLARAIYKTVAVDQEIPPELYLVMAEVLAYVYRIHGNPRGFSGALTPGPIVRQNR